MKRLALALTTLAAVTALAACGDDDANDSTNNTPANNTSANNTTPNNTSTNNTTANNTTPGNQGTTCDENEAYDEPLDTCVSCPNETYDCEATIALGSYDHTTSTLTFGPPADGAASIVSATLGGQRPGDPQNPGEEFTVEGTQDGRTWTFDVSAEETGTLVQLNSLVFTDSCGQEFDVTFVFNYTPGEEPNDPPYCPLGG
jgi:hypothetical protein